MKGKGWVDLQEHPLLTIFDMSYHKEQYYKWFIGKDLNGINI